MKLKVKRILFTHNLGDPDHPLDFWVGEEKKTKYFPFSLLSSLKNYRDIFLLINKFGASNYKLTYM